MKHMRKFKWRNKDGAPGSVTVMVTLFMVPMILVNTFMVDLARLKLYGNQAVMTADNYGAAALTIYDNVLKELYGLFAISNSTEGKAALEELEAYMTSSFNPNNNSISFTELQPLVGTTTYSGFMPYSKASVKLSMEPSTGANLSNVDVLGTQIGDFMRFRVVQAFWDEGNTILDALEEVTKMESNAKAFDQKDEYDKKAEELLREVRNFYFALKEVDQYIPYMDDVNDAYGATKKEFAKIAKSPEYQLFVQFESQKDAIINAVARRSNLAEGETLSEEDSVLCDIYDQYMDMGGREAIEDAFNEAIDAYVLSWDSAPIDFDSYMECAEKVKEFAEKVANRYEEFRIEKEKLEAVLNDENISQDVKYGIEEEIQMTLELFTVDGIFTAGHYTQIGNRVTHTENKHFNEEQKTNAERNVAILETIRNAYLELTSIPGFGPAIDTNAYVRSYKNFQYNDRHKELFIRLADTFESNSTDAAKRAESKQKDATKKIDEAQNAINQDETTLARNIPTAFPFGLKEEEGGFSLSKGIDTAVNYFSNNNLGQIGTDLVLKIYTTIYDFSMFSSRITNVEKESSEDTEEEIETKVAESLTGYEMNRKHNYLYQAELEYILGGYKDSVNNLNNTRNKILAFRTVVNFTATYTVKPINNAIRAISDAAYAINPIVAIAVAGALRTAIAAIETAQDWELLKKGEAVVLIKRETDDLSMWDPTIKNLLSDPESDDILNRNESSSYEGGEIKLDYNQYLILLIIFLTGYSTTVKRTGDLITLNVNAARVEGFDEYSELTTPTFTMDQAHTAVNATCAVQLDFVAVPNSFVKMMFGDNGTADMKKISDNIFGFTVTRGY